MIFSMKDLSPYTASKETHTPFPELMGRPIESYIPDQSVENVLQKLPESRDVGQGVAEILQKLPEQDRDDRFPDYRKYLFPASAEERKAEGGKKENDLEREREYLDRLSADEIAEKQDRLIEDVESGKIKLENNEMKGSYGEMKTDQEMRRKGFQRISKTAVVGLNGERAVNSSVTNEQMGKGTVDLKHGIDGVYEKKDGKPRYVILDAKFDTSQLESRPNKGKQMSKTWIDANLDKDVGEAKADEIRKEMKKLGYVGYCVCHVAERGDGSAANLHAPVRLEEVDSYGNLTKKDVIFDAA